MATLDDLRALGYEVGLSFEAGGVAVYRVEGLGVSTQVRDDDDDAIAGLAESHDERVKQQDETVDQTQLRWHEDPENEYELPDDAADALRERVAAQRDRSA